MKEFLGHLNVKGRALRLALCLLSSALCPLVRATELTDLGHGLTYLRVESLDAAIKPLAGGAALVLDLRHTTATSGAISTLSSTLAARPAHSRLLVLVSPATPPALAAALKGPLITLGIQGSQPAPQVVVAQSAEDDRRSYDALAGGTDLAALISGKIEKERFDEASLVQEFNLGHPGVPPATTDGAAAPDSPARLTDRVLQRAVHLHRALLALKR